VLQIFQKFQMYDFHVARDYRLQECRGKGECMRCDGDEVSIGYG